MNRNTSIAAGVLGALALAGGGAAVVKYRGARATIIRTAVNAVPFTRDQFMNGTVVSQGRAGGKGYSSCGDLWNFVLDIVGAPNSWVNRDSDKRGSKWKPAINISKPYGAAKAAGAWVDYAPGKLPKAGDLMLIGQEPAEYAHVFVVVAVAKDGTLTTADYGGINNAGHLVKRKIVQGRAVSQPSVANSIAGGRKVIGWIDADKIPRVA